MKNFLSPSVRQNLELLQKREKNRDRLDRIRSVLLKDQGWSSEKIAEALFIHQTTVDRYIREYDAGKVSADHRGRSPKLNAKQTHELVQRLKSHCYMHVKEIVSYIPIQL